jgi:hypothetical protein
VVYDYREYPGYAKLKQPGSNGVRLITTEISLTDYVETGRKDTSNVVTSAPTSEIIIKGGRTKAVCKIYGIADSKPGFMGMNKGKINVWGKCKPNNDVTLYVENKKSKTTRANSDGWFVFENVKADKNETQLELFERVNNKDQSVSEKTIVNLKTKKVIAEYALLHPKAS